MAYNPCHGTNGYASHRTPFPRPPAQPQQPPLLPLPAQAPPPVSRAKKPRCHAAAAPGAASAPITVAAPSKKRAAPATTAGLEEVEWAAGTDGSLYSVSPPPSSVPMPTSLLLTVAAARKEPTVSCCAVEVASTGCASVDAGATDELRRLLRL